jgi:hypothetical protein
MSRPATTVALVAILGLILGTGRPAARIDVKVDYDKTFDFSTLKTWAWTPGQPGEVKMARTAEDDPEVARKTAEPIILDAMAIEMPKRGLTAATGAPDVTMTYYLLLSTTMSAQTIGQFVPAVAAWGLPFIPQATQSIEFMNQGSMVLDATAGGKVVWRGVARAKIDFDASDARREKLLREGIRDLLKKFPPRR